MLTRRSLLASAGAGLLAAHVQPARAAAKLGEDGLYHLDWYLESFLDLAEDLAAATAKGKRFAIMWGLKGCPACKRMHLVHFADPKIEGYVRDNFEILHLNHIGARTVTDFDGRQLGEKALGESYGVRFTPSIQFFPEDASKLGSMVAKAREVARMPGLLDPAEFLGMFRYVREKAYETTPFADWIKNQV
jgi:thioredoxin-related protein